MSGGRGDGHYDGGAERDGQPRSPAPVLDVQREGQGEQVMHSVDLEPEHARRVDVQRVQRPARLLTEAEERHRHDEGVGMAPPQPRAAHCRHRHHRGGQEEDGGDGLDDFPLPVEMEAPRRDQEPHERHHRVAGAAQRENEALGSAKRQCAERR
jgi:hypothetical protein